MYNQDEILQQTLQAIKAEKLTDFQDIALFVAPDLSTLYGWKFHEIEAIKNGLAKNKIEAKREMRANWRKADAAPVLQLALYKLMANDEEFGRLSTTKQDVKADVTGGVAISITPMEGCEPISE